MNNSGCHGVNVTPEPLARKSCYQTMRLLDLVNHSLILIIPGAWKRKLVLVVVYFNAHGVKGIVSFH